MTDHILQLLGLVAATVIFWRAEHALNVMAPTMRFLLRVAFWLIVVGSAAFAVRIWQGYVPSVGVVLTMSGMALLLSGERRQKVRS